MKSCEVIVEKAGNNYSAYILNLLGCVTTGKTLKEIEKNIPDVVAFHLEGLKTENQKIPDLDFNNFKFTQF